MKQIRLIWNVNWLNIFKCEARNVIQASWNLVLPSHQKLTEREMFFLLGLLMSSGFLSHLWYWWEVGGARVQCSVRLWGFSKIHKVLYWSCLPTTDLQFSSYTSHLNKTAGQTFSLSWVFLAPRRVLDDVMGLTRVQSPLTSSLSLSPVSTLQRWSRQNSSQTTGVPGPPPHHQPFRWEKFTEPGMFCTSHSQWLGGLIMSSCPSWCWKFPNVM